MEQADLGGGLGESRGEAGVVEGALGEGELGDGVYLERGWLVGGLLVPNNGLTAGILVAFVLYVEQLYTPLRDLAQRWTMVQAAFASGVTLKDLETAVKDPANAGRPTQEVINGLASSNPNYQQFGSP